MLNNICVLVQLWSTFPLNLCLGFNILRCFYFASIVRWRHKYRSLRWIIYNHLVATDSVQPSLHKHIRTAYMPLFISKWKCMFKTALIARFMGPARGPSGADRTQVGPMLAPWTLLSGCFRLSVTNNSNCKIYPIYPMMLTKTKSIRYSKQVKDLRFNN